MDDGIFWSITPIKWEVIQGTESGHDEFKCTNANPI